MRLSGFQEISWRFFPQVSGISALVCLTQESRSETGRRGGHLAEANGFVGARTTGTPFWLQSNEDWRQFLMYEQAFIKRLKPNA